MPSLSSLLEYCFCSPRRSRETQPLPRAVRTTTEEAAAKPGPFSSDDDDEDFAGWDKVTFKIKH